MFTIEKGVRVPPKCAGRPCIYPWEKMKVGDSFFIKMEQKSISGAATGYGSRHHMRFVTRKEKSGTRIWRTK